MTEHPPALRYPLPELDGVRHRFVEVDGVRFHVAEAGQGEPLLLLHGWPQHWYEWRYLIDELAGDFHIVCPDLRGLGWSDAPASGYEKERLVDDVIGILDALGIERVHLIGHDWGGWVGFLLCLRRPDLVERYLALTILHPWQRFDMTLLRNSWRFTYQWFISSPGLGRWLIQRPALMHRLIQADSADPDQWSETDLRWYSGVLQDPARARASVLLYRTFLLHEALPVFRGRYRRTRLQVPTHVMVSKRDIAVPPILLRGYEPYADAMTVEVVDAGHFLPEERPALVAGRARTFFCHP
jgi:pimeloyl-ACP methyl ester carboxylesterase